MGRGKASKKSLQPDQPLPDAHLSSYAHSPQIHRLNVAHVTRRPLLNVHQHYQRGKSSAGRRATVADNRPALDSWSSAGAENRRLRVSVADLIGGRLPLAYGSLGKVVTAEVPVYPCVLGSDGSRPNVRISGDGCRLSGVRLFRQSGGHGAARRPTRQTPDKR
jgi:hypothetical protein